MLLSSLDKSAKTFYQIYAQILLRSNFLINLQKYNTNKYYGHSSEMTNQGLKDGEKILQGQKYNKNHSLS